MIQRSLPCVHNHQTVVPLLQLQLALVTTKMACKIEKSNSPTIRNVLLVKTKIIKEAHIK